MNAAFHRRDFTKAVAVGLGAIALPALGSQSVQPPRDIKIGCSTLAWNVSPTSLDNFELALKDISGLGYWGFETVGPMIEALDREGALARLMDKYRLPMKAGYMDINVTEVAALNEYGMAVADLGLRAGLHPHTGTVVEKRDEVYGVMESVNPKFMDFAPDVGQLQKGGSDAAQVVRDFAKVITHMHLKDFGNGKYMPGYCPLGMGIVDLQSILNTLEEAGNHPDVMHELDCGNAPMTARETAAFSKAYLTRLGYKFQS